MCSIFKIFKKKKIVPHIRLSGIIGSVGRFKQGINFAGQQEIIDKAFSIKKALAGNGPYIGLVASTKRARLVFEYLRDEGLVEDDLKRVHSPAGLDFSGKTPEEIALSIISEMVSIRRGGTGKPMMELRKVFPL